MLFGVLDFIGDDDDDDCVRKRINLTRDPLGTQLYLISLQNPLSSFLKVEVNDFRLRKTRKG